MQPEKIIENQILSYLKSKQIFAFKIKTVGTYDPKKGLFRKPSPWYKKGVSDILGIYKGRPLAIEVKTESGRLSPFQKIFLTEWTEQGGIAILARSIEDLEKQLGDADEGLLVTSDAR